MATQDLAAALARAQTCLQRRPDMGMHEDSPAVAHWMGGTRIVASHANGTSVATDIAAELGGSGDRASPGWLFRASIGACAATCIALMAARAGIELTRLSVRVSGRSDTRGVLGMSDSDGRRVSPAPRDLVLAVEVAAENASAAQLREVVAEAWRRAPVPSAVQAALPLMLDLRAVED